MDDLSKKSDVELKELIHRQNNLLLNKHVISKLKDRGSKMKNFKRCLEEELSRREEKARLAPVTTNLSFNVTNTETLEWTGNCDPTVSDESSELLDDCDENQEETDPLKILAEQAGAGHYKKVYRTKKPEASLITEADVLDVSGSACGDSSESPYVSQLCYHVEHAQRNTRIPFKPHSTVKSPKAASNDPKKPKGPHWEVTAASPPDYTLTQVKSVTLSESLQLQKQHNLKVQECQAKQMSDRLAAQIERMHLAERRGSNASTSTNEDKEHEEEHLDDEVDERGVVIYSLVD